MIDTLLKSLFSFVMLLFLSNILFFFSPLCSYSYLNTFFYSVLLEEGTVKSLLEENGSVKGVLYKTKTCEEIKVYAPLTIVCDGCFSNLRRSLCSPKVFFDSILNPFFIFTMQFLFTFMCSFFSPQVDVPSCFVGLVLENCELPYPNHGHVILADPSPILFYPISSTEVRCLVDVPGEKVPSVANGEMAKYLKTVVAPQVCSIFFLEQDICKN